MIRTMHVYSSDINALHMHTTGFCILKGVETQVFMYSGFSMLGGPVTMAWRVLRLRMEERPPVIEGSCEYVELVVADS
jgi:hypothetical protein